MPHILLLEDDETIAFGIRCAMEKEGGTTVWCRTLKAVSYTHLTLPTT